MYNHSTIERYHYTIYRISNAYPRLDHAVFGQLAPFSSVQKPGTIWRIHSQQYALRSGDERCMAQITDLPPGTYEYRSNWVLQTTRPW